MLFQVIKMLGNGRLEAFCFDGTKRLCHIRGKLRKKVNYFKGLSTNLINPLLFLFCVVFFVYGSRS